MNFILEAQMDDKENTLEIYRQRYETFRYLDNLHWFMLQIAVGAGTIATTYLSTSDTVATWWHYVMIGVLFTSIGIAMLRIKSGARANNLVLKKVACKIGDTDIPNNRSLTTSVSYWVTLAIILLGFSSIIFGIYTFCGDIN